MNILDLTSAPKQFPDAVAGVFAGTTYVVTGLTLSATGAGSLSITVAAGSGWVNGTHISYAGGTVVPGAAGTNPRYDLIRIANGAAVPSIVAGTASTTPAFPALGAGDLFLGYAFIGAGATDYTVAATANLQDFTMPQGMNPMTTLGDMVYALANGKPQRLGIGTGLQQLRTNAGATAPEWFTVAGAAFTQIGQTVLAAAVNTITFSSIPATSNHLMLLLSSREDAGADFPDVYMQFNGDSGGNYDDMIVRFAGNGGTAITQTIVDVAATQFRIGTMSSNAPAGHADVMELIIQNYSRTTLRKAWNEIAFNVWATPSAADNNTNISLRSGTWRNTAAITSVTLTIQTNKFAIGTVATLYGLT